MGLAWTIATEKVPKHGESFFNTANKALRIFWSANELEPGSAPTRKADASAAGSEIAYHIGAQAKNILQCLAMVAPPATPPPHILPTPVPPSCPPPEDDDRDRESTPLTTETSSRPEPTLKPWEEPMEKLSARITQMTALMETWASSVQKWQAPSSCGGQDGREGEKDRQGGDTEGWDTVQASEIDNTATPGCVAPTQST